MDAALQRTTKNSSAEDEPQQELGGTIVTTTTSTRKNFFTEPRENATLLEPKAKPTKDRVEPRETPRY